MFCGVLLLQWLSCATDAVVSECCGNDNHGTASLSIQSQSFPDRVAERDLISHPVQSAGSVGPEQGAQLADAVSAGVPEAEPEHARREHTTRGHPAQLVPRQLHLLPPNHTVRQPFAQGTLRTTVKTVHFVLLYARAAFEHILCLSSGFSMYSPICEVGWL